MHDQIPPDSAEAIALVRPIVARMAPLSSESRIALLCALLAQEVCMLPGPERAEELESILEDLPGIVRATERGMREALVQNARDGK